MEEAEGNLDLFNQMVKNTHKREAAALPDVIETDITPNREWLSLDNDALFEEI